MLNPHNIDTVYILRERYIFVRKGYIIGAGPTELDFTYALQFKNAKEIVNDNTFISKITYNDYITKYIDMSNEMCE